MSINVVEEVAEGRAHVSWATVRSTYQGKTLLIYVFRDAMKFDQVPALQWNFKPLKAGDPWGTSELFDGVRLPASAFQLQQIADLTGSMLLTPRVIDLIWLQASLKFDAVTQTQSYPDADLTDDGGVIVANSHVHVVHQKLEAIIAALGGDDGEALISCVGKYWCLIDRLRLGGLRFGAASACNYGWPSSKASGPGVTPGVLCWQRPGFRHDHHHWDPSQTIRLMYREGILIHEDGQQERVALADIAADPKLAGLLHHSPGALLYLRQAGVPRPGSDVAMARYKPPLALVA